MAERLPPLPQMQAKIDALLDVYGEGAVPTYSTDGTTCIILSEHDPNSSSTYVCIVQMNLETLTPSIREVTVEPGQLIDTIII